MSKKQNHGYILGLKIFGPHYDDVHKCWVGGAGIGWAVMQRGRRRYLKPNATIKSQAEEAFIVDYADPQDMLEPMPRDEYLRRLEEVKAGLPDGIKVVMVEFDKESYARFLRELGLKDDHNARAKWAASQNLDDLDAGSVDAD